MSRRTRLLPLAGVLAVLGACGQPPRPLPTSPPLSAATAAPSAGLPSPPAAGQPLPTAAGTAGNPPAYPPTSVRVLPPGLPTANPTPPALPATPPALPATTAAPATRPPSPTPTHAPRCTGEPTGAQILALVRLEPGIPRATLRIADGPRCSGAWSFSTVAVAGATDGVEPLMAVTIGRGSTLDVVAVGSEVCTARVQRDAPPAVRVLACGF